MAKDRQITGIKTWPEDDRPREKLLKKGAKAELGGESRAESGHSKEFINHRGVE